MCGIAGWVAAPGEPIAPEAMGAMLEALAHRGPDGFGQRAFVAATTGHAVMLGHRRLAIIDPERCAPADVRRRGGPGAHLQRRDLQLPRAERASSPRSACRFRLDSDTEVLLRGYQAWGLDVVHRLRGMFAFALWDARRERLFMARDRFGEKPLFVHEGPRGLAFASEIKALLQGAGRRARRGPRRRARLPRLPLRARRRGRSTRASAS